MTGRICVSILPKNTKDATSLIEKVEEAHPDFIEVRFDHLKEARQLADIVASTRIPLIATNRQTSKQREFTENRTEKQKILLDAAKIGFKYVDLELINPKVGEMAKEVKAVGAKPIVSFHDYTKPLSISEMSEILEREKKAGAEICKIVTTAKRIEDNLAVLDFIKKASIKTSIVCFCMGEIGKISRLLSPFFGGFFTFASLETGSETAPGQMNISEMRAIYEVLGGR